MGAYKHAKSGSGVGKMYRIKSASKNHALPISEREKIYIQRKKLLDCEALTPEEYTRRVRKIANDLGL